MESGMTKSTPTGPMTKMALSSSILEDLEWTADTPFLDELPLPPYEDDDDPDILYMPLPTFPSVPLITPEERAYLKEISRWSPPPCRPHAPLYSLACAHLKHLKKERLPVRSHPSCTRNRSSFARPHDLHKITVLDQALEVTRDIYPTIRECRESSSHWEENFWDAHETHQHANFYQRTTDDFYHSLVCC